jgi:RimJ/RimL family protein N-acetyltransferase
LALSRWLLVQPGVIRVFGRAELSNTPSRRALERAGFVLESSGALYAVYALSA